MFRDLTLMEGEVAKGLFFEAAPIPGPGKPVCGGRLFQLFQGSLQAVVGQFRRTARLAQVVETRRQLGVAFFHELSQVQGRARGGRQLVGVGHGRCMVLAGEAVQQGPAQGHREEDEGEQQGGQVDDQLHLAVRCGPEDPSANEQGRG